MIEILESKWSEWLDNNQEIISQIPEKPGVYMMHESMKILLIEGSQNMQKSINQALVEKCISNSTRIRFREETNYDQIKNKLISDYKKRHEGNNPQCMS